MLKLGRDRSNNRLILERIFIEEYRMCGSFLRVENKKISLYFTVKISDKIQKFDKNISVSVDLGINVHAYVALSTGYIRLVIGSYKDFFRVRNQIQVCRKHMQYSLKMVLGGKGRKKKLKKLEIF